MSQEPTLDQLEDQTPQSEEDLIQAIQDVDEQVATTWVVIKNSQQEIADLVAKGVQLRTQLRLLRASKSSGTTEPICPDGTTGEL